jgi:hypothetical protein
MPYNAKAHDQQGGDEYEAIAQATMPAHARRALTQAGMTSAEWDAAVTAWVEQERQRIERRYDAHQGRGQ